MPTQEQARVADELTAVIARLQRRSRAASASAQGALTPSQVSVLGRIGSGGPATTAALARAETVRPQSMRMTLAALEERGLVARSPHPTDGRQVVFSLTGAGVRLRGTGRRARPGWLAEAIDAELSAEDQRRLTEALGILQRLVEA
ncbi:MarR family winged helix-turn-helix transcriptional regulator [Streptomyces sp. CBMA29]|uniref:MarR family winged helix-turn-helix transcriptional regulator n=1 Tax=Streptomyces sp. CBMA29 TaxID=1896314 RepID=UPI001661FB29|nr:MarR family transcriptional regulator [Streptomyces sp. CBMA29]MBD0739469.1 MarR family transcriptional regulator [Streptomyces sp. CBMA29]